jgi:hypothetical protein
MSALLVLFISTMLMVDLASCKSKPKPEEGQSMKDMPGMDMKNMKGMEMKKSSDTATAPKLDIKVDDLIKHVNQTIISQVATFQW